MPANYYTVLGLTQSASPAEIRSRFLDLARSRHPDRFQGEEKEAAEAEFQAITQAFNILSNPTRRRQHDQELARRKPTHSKGDPAQIARVYMTRGVKAYRDKDYREAAVNFDRAVQNEPGNAQAWHHLARALAHQTRYLPKAASAIRRACDLETMNVGYLLTAARIHAQAGKEEEALEFLDQARRWGADEVEAEEVLEELSKGRKRFPGLFGKGE